MDKIYIGYTVVPNGGWKGSCYGLAIAENGKGFASHISSTPSFSEKDMTNENKRKAYKEHYPDGYEIIWFGLLTPEVKGFVDACVASVEWVKDKSLDLNEDTLTQSDIEDYDYWLTSEELE
ncbi:MAG: hypothetical protein KAS32_21725 [Candidatus Peribacteraceae bacterium]|nr:hypothetical protein [Candidatus Peribacteraceae bacterium]